MSACPKCGHDPAAKVLATWSFLIERDPPSLNARIFNAGLSRWRYGKERDAWQWEIRAVRLLKRIPTAGSRRRRVTLTRVYGGKQQKRDRDNLAGGMKAIIDALVHERLIVDDSETFVELNFTQERGEPRGLRFTIEELG